jgi:hypothetical protein
MDWTNSANSASAQQNLLRLIIVRLINLLRLINLSRLINLLRLINLSRLISLSTQIWENNNIQYGVIREYYIMSNMYND